MAAAVHAAGRRKYMIVAGAPGDHGIGGRSADPIGTAGPSERSDLSLDEQTVAPSAPLIAGIHRQITAGEGQVMSQKNRRNLAAGEDYDVCTQGATAAPLISF